MDPSNTVVILSACRTPLGCFQGSLSSMSSSDLGAVVFKEAVRRAGISESDIDAAYLGNVLQGGGGQNPCRQAVLKASLPESISCTSINKVCASGLKAVHFAAQSILSGDVECVLAGGSESMSNSPYMIPKARAGLRMGNGEIVDSLINDGLWDPFNNQHMGLNTETTAEEYDLTREAQDDYSEMSYKRAQQWWEGDNHDEVVPVEISSRGKVNKITQDEQVSKANFAKMRTLKPCFKKEGTITPANASAIGDGAAAVVLASLEFAQRHGLTPMAKIVASADGARDPLHFTIAPVLAAEKALKRAGMTKEDVDLFDINEAFAAVVLANVKILGLDMDKVNIRGGGISLTHPLGASGCIRLVALLYALRDEKKRHGLAALCVGGGEGHACVVENLLN
ncbi:hypothetical protein P9112_011172 [Eukaryota sp. TZLM1-RC]